MSAASCLASFYGSCAKRIKKELRRLGERAYHARGHVFMCIVTRVPMGYPPELSRSFIKVL